MLGSSEGHTTLHTLTAVVGLPRPPFSLPMEVSYSIFPVYGRIQLIAMFLKIRWMEWRWYVFCPADHSHHINSEK